MKKFNQLLWFIKDKDSYYPINKINVNPFKNYKQALKFLKEDINSKTILSNYNPSKTDLALLTIFKSKRLIFK